jgi:hypothetical protein
MSSNSAPIPPPPHIPSTTFSTPSPAAVISRPPKRYVRPRATTEAEKEQRLKERKVANRTAAKQSRDRQKQAMDQAQLENDHLKKENTDLRTRIATLEQRMQALESQPRQTPVPTIKPEEGETSVPTHQSARPMSPEPQCPTLVPSSPHLRLTQTRIVVYALQILMHSFVVSLNFPPHLLPQTTWTRWISSFRPCSLQPRRRRQSTTTKTSRTFSPWMLAQTGYATPNRDDLSGAIRSSAGMLRGGDRRMRLRMLGKESLRVVRRDGRRGKGACIRLIIKKGRQRMHK